MAPQKTAVLVQATVRRHTESDKSREAKLQRSSSVALGLTAETPDNKTQVDLKFAASASSVPLAFAMVKRRSGC